MSKKTLLLDFDGTLHDYNGEYNPDGLGEPIANARHACLLLERDYRLVVFTSRPTALIEPWLRRHGFPKMLVTNLKLPCFAIVDDRAICFPGAWTDNFLLTIRDFQPHWKSQSPSSSPSGEDPADKSSSQSQ